LQGSKHEKEVIKMMMPVRLRGHHFLCMLTYRGFGYSAEFTGNMSVQIAKIRHGAPVVLVTGPDDICAGMSKACTHATGHDCRAGDILEMDKTAKLAVEAVLERGLGDIAPINQDELQKLRMAFADGTLRAACQGCSWFEVCNSIVAEQFYGTQLLMIEP
jgi:uncharacterized protein